MASPISQLNIQALPDFLQSDRFVLKFGQIPIYGDSFNALTLKCVDVVLPGQGNERFEVALQGFVRNFRGRKTYQRVFTATLAETVDASALTALWTWGEAVVGTNSGNSLGYNSQYSVLCEIDVFDTTGALSTSAQTVRTFPIDVVDTQFAGQNTGPVNLQVQFAYDYVKYRGVALL